MRLTVYFINSDLRILECDIPQINENQLLVKTSFAGVNRPDIIQQKGFYHPPDGASEILGLEISGEVVAIGSAKSYSDSKRSIHLGDQVFGLVNGGAYAEYCVMEKDLAIKVPDNLTLERAASLSENWLTAIFNLVFVAGINEADTQNLLIHAGGSGVGIVSIQLANHLNQRVFATVGSNQKVEYCNSLGATTFNYRECDFAQEIKNDGSGKLDIILDCVGAKYFEKNISLLKDGGKLISIGVLSGSKVELNLGLLLVKRLQIIGSTLRPQSNEIKSLLTEFFATEILPRIDSFPILIDSIYHYSEIKQAHEKMDSNLNFGKILVSFD